MKSKPVSLSDLLKALPGDWKKDLTRHDLSLPVRSVTSDSREVMPGTVFVATRGAKSDGHDFIATAQQSGAALVVAERAPAHETLAPYLVVPDSRLALGLLAARFYGSPSLHMKMLGVTGTSGKTTTTYLLESILQASGLRVGVIGTVNFRFGNRVYPSTHTTPGAVELQKLLSEMQKDGCQAVIMEVSSHALKQHRVAGIAWDGMIFTNLTREHLDFHPDMEDYFRSKAKLFRECADFSRQSGKKPFSAVNLDDPYGKKLWEELESEFQKSREKIRAFASFSIFEKSEINAEGLKSDLGGIRGQCREIKIHSPLMARFNVQNILGAVTLARGLGLPNQAIENGISSLKSVPGRLESVPNDQGVHVWVDYAHKPDALEKVLATLDELKEGHSLITVFGCGGDRDREKRPVMGKLALERSDFVYVTSDNPRTESPDAIIREIVTGMASGQHFEIESDRRQAIFKAIRKAKKGDLVLIAGKGHEDYQILPDPSASKGTIKVHFDDREVALEALHHRNRRP